LSWTHKHNIGDKVKYKEPVGFAWDAEVVDVSDCCIRICWARNESTHPQWGSFLRAYVNNYQNIFSESSLNND